MIAALRTWIYRQKIDAEIRRYQHNLVAIEKRMADDLQMAQTVRGYLALAQAAAKSDRYQGAEISDATYRAWVWRAIFAAYGAANLASVLYFFT